MKETWLGLWIASDGKVVFIERDAEGSLFVTVQPGITEDPYPETDHFQAGSRTYRLPATFTPREPGERFGNRLDFLKAEAGQPGFGRTYNLGFAVENTDPEVNWGMRWAPVPDGTPVEQVWAVPEVGAGYPDAVAQMDDEGEIEWAAPYGEYRRATAAECRQFASRT